MSSRVRHESGSHIRKPSYTSTKKTMDENKIVQPSLKAKALGSVGPSTKPNPLKGETKPAQTGQLTVPLMSGIQADKYAGLKNKSSRPVLASLTNATPRAKPINPKSQSHTITKPSGVFKTPSAPKIRPPQTPGAKTPTVAPKSTKKAISVYTPGPRPTGSKTDEYEVESTHLRPARTSTSFGLFGSYTEADVWSSSRRWPAHAITRGNRGKVDVH